MVAVLSKILSMCLTVLVCFPMAGKLKPSPGPFILLPEARGSFGNFLWTILNSKAAYHSAER